MIGVDTIDRCRSMLAGLGWSGGGGRFFFHRRRKKKKE
jgi:hypothetical protein